MKHLTREPALLGLGLGTALLIAAASPAAETGAVVDDLFAIHARASFQAVVSRLMSLCRYTGSIAQVFVLSSGGFDRQEREDS